MERGGNVADVLQRIGMSPLAVIRTGMIQANMALLSSSRLQAHESEHLLEMLLGELVISSDRNLRQVACELLSARLRLVCTDHPQDSLSIVSDLEFHLRSRASPAVKEDLICVLIRALQHDDDVCNHWLEALVCSPSVLECIALDVTLSPVHLTMSRQLSHYALLRELQLTRDTFFIRLFQLLQQKHDEHGQGGGSSLQELRVALLHKLAEGSDGSDINEMEQIVSTSCLKLLEQICTGSTHVCTLAAGEDSLLVFWRQVLLDRRRQEESVACLHVLRQVLLNLPLPDLERIWFRKDFGCMLFEVRFEWTHGTSFLTPSRARPRATRYAGRRSV